MCALIVLIVISQKWRIAHEYFFFLFHFIKMTRFMIVQTTFEFAFVIAKFITNEKTVLSYVIAMMNKCMIRNNQNVMQWMLNDRVYDMKIHYDITSFDNVNWMKKQIRYKHIEFEMNQLRNMIRVLRNKIVVALKVVIHCKKLDFFFIFWLNLRNDSSRDDFDHNFVKNDRNSWLMNDSNWLIEHLIDQKILLQRAQKFDRNKMLEWFRLIDRFHALLITLIQWVWNQNARDSKFLNMNYQNANRIIKRNVFIVTKYDNDENQNSQIKFVIRYHKKYIINDTIKVIHRFLLKKMKILMIYVLWLMQSI